MAEHTPQEGDETLIKQDAADAGGAMAAAQEHAKPAQTDQASGVKEDPNSATPSRHVTATIHSPHTQQPSMYGPGMPYGTPGHVPPPPPPGYHPYPHHPTPMAHHYPHTYWPASAVTHPPAQHPHTVPAHHPACTKPLDRYPPPPDLAVEGTRHGATSPSQIDASHKQEVEHMGCTCKKTRCLKLYCQCFGAKLYCGPNCRCMNCSNNKEEEGKRQEAMRVIMGRNPNAFDTKFQKAHHQSDVGNNGATPTDPAKPTTPTENKTLSHKVGCKCRKSACMKKYCECYAGNVKCTVNCRCVGCKNMGPGELAVMMYGGGVHMPASLGVGDVAAATMAPAVVAPPHTAVAASPPAAPMPLPAHPFPHMHPGQVMQAASQQHARTPTADGGSTNGGMGQAYAVKSEQEQQQTEGGANMLMLAAYAMTEFGQGSSAPGSNPKKRPRAQQENTHDDKRVRMEV